MPCLPPADVVPAPVTSTWIQDPGPARSAPVPSSARCLTAAAPLSKHSELVSTRPPGPVIYDRMIESCDPWRLRQWSSCPTTPDPLGLTAQTRPQRATVSSRRPTQHLGGCGCVAPVLVRFTCSSFHPNPRHHRPRALAPSPYNSPLTPSPSVSMATFVDFIVFVVFIVALLTMATKLSSGQVRSPSCAFRIPS